MRKGMTVAVLDSGELAAQAMQAEGNVMAARSGLEQSELDLRRAELLSGQGAISAQAYDAARTKRDLALGQLRSAEGISILISQFQFSTFRRFSTLIVHRAPTIN